MNSRTNPKNGNKRILGRDNIADDSDFFGRILKHQILSADEKAKNLLQNASDAASKLIADAEVAARAIRDDAYKSGHEESVGELLADLLAARQQRLDALHDIEGEVLKLAVKAAEKIIGREIELNENVRAEIVETALRQARQREVLTVRVNAADLPLIAKMRERTETGARPQNLDFVSDRNVTQGGCLIESPSNTIDARLETQLRVLENNFLDQVREPAEKN